MPSWIICWTDAVRPYRAGDVEIIDADELQATDSWLVWWGLRWVIGQPRLIVVLRAPRREVASVARTGVHSPETTAAGSTEADPSK